MKTRDCENVFESKGNHCALPGLAGVGGLCSCYRVFRLLRNFWGAGLEDKFLMKNHSIGCLCLNYYFIPPFQSLPNLFLNLFLLFERKSIGKHLSIYLTPTSEVISTAFQSDKDYQNFAHGDFWSLSSFLGCKFNCHNRTRKSRSTPFSHSLLFRTLKQNQSRRDATHGSLN